jgi:cytochrome c oxidase subunit 2
MSLFPLFPEQASTMAARVDALLLFLVLVTAFFVTLIATCILVFMVKYRRRSADERPAPVHMSIWLEIAWTAIPLVLVMVMFFWGATLYASLRRPPDDAIPISVVGRQWMWKMQHLEGKREINELHVPVGRPVKITMTSEDVIHGFFVPAFRIKQDAVPGMYTTTWFEATRPGTYQLFCSAYCGTLHSGMIGRIIVMEPRDFEAWLGGAAAGAMPVAAAGEALFQSSGCQSCHQPGGQGPVLAAVFGSRVKLANGTTVVADEGYLRESILNPQAKIVAGYGPIMPTYQGLLGEEDVLKLIAYIKSLAPPATAGGGTSP